MKKQYDPKEAESRIQKFWERKKIYSFDSKSKKPVYSIDTPPPTISGKMHVGHAFSYSQQDFIARYKRMSGFNVFYPFGTDDNGLPTKLLVEKEKGVKASKMDRKKFVKLCLDTLKKELRPSYVKNWKDIGMSCDFDLFYSTIDSHSQKISQQSFIDLYNSGREYRTETAAMYCPKCQTAISQVELEDKEEKSMFNDLVFKTEKEDLLIATTRPEYLSACVALFYHPDDKRYQKFNGQNAIVPLYDFEVPILADKRVEMDKGTGLVMSCTFGDSTDVEWQKVFHLPIKKAVGRDGLMTEIAGKYKGQKIEDARKNIIEDLKEKKLLVSQKPIKRAINVHERCGIPIEYYHSKQWFIKYLDLKPKMLEWGQNLNWYPAHMKNRYDNWVKGLQWDWCISRQIPFGVPFPVWYCSECEEVILAKSKDLPVDPTIDKAPVDACPKCKCKKIIPETDIINTWATSSLTPQIAQGLIPKTKIYPMSLRPQAHDIISFWLFNTVVKSQLHSNKNPWSDVAISGWVLDPKGRKMSKSKGNVIEPSVMLEKYSADAFRYFSAGSKLGEDVPFQEKELVAGQKLINKMWNASKFVYMQLEGFEKGSITEGFDKWILLKLDKLISSNTESFNEYDYNQVRLGTENFFWNMFCDDYLEIVKDRTYNPDVRGIQSSNSGKQALFFALLDSLKMMAPFMPHITEEIYLDYYSEKEKCDSIHLSSWPKIRKFDVSYEEKGDRAVDIIHKVRKFKSDKQVSMKAPIQLTLTKKDEKELKEFLDDIKAVCNAEEILIGDKVLVRLV